MCICLLLLVFSYIQVGESPIDRHCLPPPGEFYEWCLSLAFLSFVLSFHGRGSRVPADSAGPIKDELIDVEQDWFLKRRRSTCCNWILWLPTGSIVLISIS